MTRYLMIGPVLAVGLAVSAAAQQVSEQDAQQAGQGLLDAWNKTRETPQGLISGRAAIESAIAAEPKDYTSDPRKLEQVKMIGDEVMLRAGTWSGTYNGPNRPVHLKGYWSDTDVRNGNTWKIRQETYNVTPASQVKN